MGALALDAKLCMWISTLLSDFTYIAIVDKGLILILQKLCCENNN